MPTKPIADIPKEKRKSVISKKKRWERLRIRELMAEGYSYHQIKAQFPDISDATYRNRLNEIRMEDNEIIAQKLLREGTFLVTDLTVLDDRLGDAIRFCKQLIDDPKISPWLKFEAKKFQVDVSVAKFKLQAEGPRIIDEVTKPIQRVVRGELKPIQALEGVRKLKSATNEEKERYKEVWAAQVQEGKEERTGSQVEKAQG